MTETPTLPRGAADGTRPAGAASPGTAPDRAFAAVLRPLLLDVAVPVGGYYLLHAALGVGLVMSLALSGVVPAVRAVLAMVTRRRANALALLMVGVNAAGIGLSFVTGDPRIMLAKDSGVSSVIGLSILLSALGSRPLMSAGLRPLMTRGEPAKTAAWDRLAAGSPRFRRLERLFSVIWGVALLAECTARLVGAFTLPVATMAWLGSVLTLGGIGAAIVLGGVATRPMEAMLTAEALSPTA